MDKSSLPPFFIIGCARSGTTLLRNVLRLHPNLNAPEETFIYRWGEPFATDGFRHPYLHNPTIKHHQEIDGIAAEKAAEVLAKSKTRSDFSNRYARVFLERAKNGQRWFDKTPQNIYGILLIRAQFPDSKIIHIHRNPLNVITSLMLGQVMPKQSLVAAVNYWIEAMQIIDVYKKIPDNNLIELRYEALLESPESTLSQLLSDLGEDPAVYDFSKLILPPDVPLQPGDIVIEPEKDKYQQVLSAEDISFILRYCGPYMKRYGYQLS